MGFLQPQRWLNFFLDSTVCTLVMLNLMVAAMNLARLKFWFLCCTAGVVKPGMRNAGSLKLA